MTNLSISFESSGYGHLYVQKESSVKSGGLVFVKIYAKILMQGAYIKLCKTIYEYSIFYSFVIKCHKLSRIIMS